MTEITSGFETIGPKEAARILSRVHERQAGRDYKATIDQYAKQMVEGSWDEAVAQTISVSDRGELMDGWHRLHAVIKADRAVRFLVVRNVPSEAFAKFDAGRARSLAFRTGMTSETAAIATMLLKVCKYGERNRGATPEEAAVCLDFVLPELQIFRERTSQTRKRKLTTTATQLACLLRMKDSKAQALDICAQFSMLQHGDLTQATKVVGHLYRRLLEENNPPLIVFCLSYQAFDPSRAAITRLLIRDASAIIHEVREGVLDPLVQALR